MVFTKHQLSLITLWAFVEAGLGSLLHAFHLPFTGLVLGGFAVLIISLLAQSTRQCFKVIMQAMLIVLAIKVCANPATSPFAYIAVAFQGLLGAIIYNVLGVHFVSHILFATIAMLQSAVQKLLVVTLFFGKTFWQGVDALGTSILQQLHCNSQVGFAQIIIIAYVSLFIIWGSILAFWMNKLPIHLQIRKHLYANLQPITVQSKVKVSSKKYKYLLAFCIVLSIGTFFISSKHPLLNASIYLLRTVSVLAVWQWVIVPIWAKWILAKQSNIKTSTNFVQVRQQLPSIAAMVKPLYQQVASQHKGITIWKEFLLGLIICSTRK
jgi:hypothetical protein